jgi:hypothetical protein
VKSPAVVGWKIPLYNNEVAADFYLSQREGKENIEENLEVDMVKEP